MGLQLCWFFIAYMVQNNSIYCIKYFFFSVKETYGSYYHVPLTCWYFNFKFGFVYRYPNYEILGDQSIAKLAAVATRYSDNSLFGIVIDIHFLSLSDYLVCTFSSQVSKPEEKKTIKILIKNVCNFRYAE